MRIRYYAALALLLISAPAFSATGTAESMLLNHVAEAQKKLVATEQSIASQRQRMSQRLNSLEREVLALREKTAVARRLEDEKTLSLSQLEARLESWQKQQVYQQNLLHRFLQQHAQPEDLKTGAPISAQLAAVNNISLQLEQRFSPNWGNDTLVMASGKMASVPTLHIGPVTWYWDETNQQAGFASRQDNTLHIDALLSGSQSNTIADLRTQSAGQIVFDPTLHRALIRQQQTESLLEHVTKGGLWAIPIILFALFALSIALLKVAQLWRLPKLVRFTPTALESALTNPASPITAKVKGMQKTLLTIGVSSATPRQRDDQLFMQLQDDKHQLDRWIGAIAITAAVSPLLGLLGTVSGMIETFKMMTLFGSGDPEVVSGGIAQALVTTELGLVVAIPALILNALLSRRAKTYYNELESFAVLISKSDELNVTGTEPQKPSTAEAKRDNTVEQGEPA
jgi:biopolymer transport protein ExbB